MDFIDQGNVGVQKFRVSRHLSKNVPELTGLRGIAVTFVVLYHGGVPHLIGASLGVDIFFVLSGFLITALLVCEADSRDSVDLKAFYKRRILRLFPAFLVMLLGVTVYAAVGTNTDTFEKTLRDSAIALIYLTNWARAFHWNEPVFLGHAWSLSIEEQFYLMWPAIFVMARRAGNPKSVVVCAVAIFFFATATRIAMQALHVDPLRIYNGLDTRADSLLAGCILALAYTCGALDGVIKMRRLPGIALAALAALVILASSMDQLSNWSNYAGYSLIELCTAVLILQGIAGGRGLASAIMRSRMFMWLGERSYAIYLWHFPLCIILLSRGHSQLSTCLIAGPAALILSVISRELVESPFIRMKKRWRAEISPSG